MTPNISSSGNLKDLMTTICPNGCLEQCQRIYTNAATGHRIVCICSCHDNDKIHNKKDKSCRPASKQDRQTQTQQQPSTPFQEKEFND